MPPSNFCKRLVPQILVLIINPSCCTFSSQFIKFSELALNKNYFTSDPHRNTANSLRFAYPHLMPFGEVFLPKLLFFKVFVRQCCCKAASCSPQLFPKAALQNYYRKPCPKEAPQNSAHRLRKQAKCVR